MILHLIDTNQALVDAWLTEFADFNEVHISCGDLLSCAVGTVVSPANSSGYMDGGIDAAYAQFFGSSIESKIRAAINARSDGMLPVGASLVIETAHPKITSIIVAPSMVMPEPVPKAHCYRAFRAALRVANDPLVADTVYCPGIGTGVGRVDPVDAAAEMAEAYRDWCAVDG